MPSFVRPFRRLQWKLTFSYTWITLTTLGLLMLASSVVGSELAAADVSHLVVENLRSYATGVEPYLSAAPPDRAGIASWLQRADAQTNRLVVSQIPGVTSTVTTGGFITEVVDQQGVVLASRGPDAVSAGTPLLLHLPQSGTTALRAALSGQTDAGQLVAMLPHDTVLVAYPVVGPDGRIEGALVEQTSDPVPSQPVLLLDALVSGLHLALPVAILAALIGSLFGFLTARGFSQRFQRLSGTVEQWGQGNFTLRAIDASGDELGQLTRRLNLLAEEFQGLLSSQQQLATLEERHRLARDLHDSVKQQVFAISMLVNSAKRQLSLDRSRAETYLEETDTYVQHVQQELTTMVHALRPAALAEHGLVAAVSDLTAHWSEQSGIGSEVKVEGTLSPSLKVEEALFRIAQEALANTARHSQATQVELTLTSRQDRCTLTVDDNGQGFDSATLQGQGVGLRSMQERIQAVGGTLNVTSALGKGTRVTACCPAFGLGEGAEERRDGADYDPHCR